jgi:hypothetical protein
VAWVPEILEMMEEGDAYIRWQNYGTWIGADGRPLAESALQDEKERTERLKNKRPTLPLTNVIPSLYNPITVTPSYDKSLFQKNVTKIV